MLYGDEKRREMARSILPSTARKSARVNKRINNKRARAKVRAELRRCLFDEEYADEADLFYEPSWSYIVRDRQEADKLNHFMRWAEAITQDIPRDDRLKYVRGLLPDGLIGWHAVSHLEFRDHFKTQAEIDQWEARVRSWGTARKRRTREEDIELLWEIMEDSRLHRLFNRWVKSVHSMVIWRFPDREVEVGPATAPHLDHPESFYDKIKEARRMRGVKVEPYMARSTREAFTYYKDQDTGQFKRRVNHTYTVEWPRGTMPSPDHHPEWWRATNGFLDLYVQHRERFNYAEFEAELTGRRRGWHLRHR